MFACNIQQVYSMCMCAYKLHCVGLAAVCELVTAASPPPLQSAPCLSSSTGTITSACPNRKRLGRENVAAVCSGTIWSAELCNKITHSGTTRAMRTTVRRRDQTKVGVPGRRMMKELFAERDRDREKEGERDREDGASEKLLIQIWFCVSVRVTLKPHLLFSRSSRSETLLGDASRYLRLARTGPVASAASLQCELPAPPPTSFSCSHWRVSPFNLWKPPLET